MRFLISAFAIAVSASPALALDDCLLGTWQADLDDLADIMANQMNGQATPVGGTVTMSITPEGIANMTVNNMVLNVVVPDVPPMDVSVNGVSSGAFTGEDGAWSVVTASYDLVGAADVMGQTMEIPFSSATGMFGGGNGTYQCDGTALTFDSEGPNPRIPRRWARIG